MIAPKHPFFTKSIHQRCSIRPNLVVLGSSLRLLPLEKWCLEAKKTFQHEMFSMKTLRKILENLVKIEKNCFIQPKKTGGEGSHSCFGGGSHPFLLKRCETTGCFNFSHPSSPNLAAAFFLMADAKALRWLNDMEFLGCKKRGVLLAKPHLHFGKLT